MATNRFAKFAILIKRLGRRTIDQRANQLLSLCIVICTSVAGSLGLFANSVQTALDADIAQYLGAPLVVRTDHALPLELFDGDDPFGVVSTASFTTGALSDSGYQSVSFKGVSDGYPLQGELIVRDGAGEAQRSAGDLQAGEVWLDPRAMDELAVDLGDHIQIGSSQLSVVGELVHEPDRLTQLQHALPRAMVGLQTLDLSGVSEGNDRGEYRVLVAGSDVQLQQIETRLQAALSQRYEVLRPDKGRHPFSRISQRAERLLNVILVLILLMCGAAAATLADHTVRNYALPATVLRCMGVDRRAVAWAFCLQLLGLALVMSLLGCAVGALAQPWLIEVMQPHMTLSVAPLSWRDLLGPVAIGQVTVVAFVIPKLQRLGVIPVTRVLRGQIDQPRGLSLTTFLAVTVAVGVLWFSSDNLQLTLMLVGAVAFVIVLSIGFGWGLSKASAQAHRLFRGPLKVAVRSIGRSPVRHITPLAAVSIAMMAILLTATLRGSFLDVLQVQSLVTDGNYIFTGLPAAQRDNFVKTADQTGAQLKGIYPTVSARLVSINGVPIDRALKKESDTREETRSKVRLSWAAQLPDNNTLLRGSWPGPASNEVSVEYEVMTDLGLQMGDVLGFQIGNAVLNSTISSQREYKSGGSRMMFWFMFAPDALAQFDAHYMGGLLLNNEAAGPALSKLHADFPQVRITDLERRIAGIREIMIVLTRLMNTTLFLLLGGAVMVMAATSFVSADNRKAQSSLLRVLGLRRSQCYAMNMIEQSVIALVACLNGIVGVQLIGGLLFHQLFALTYVPEWPLAVGLTALVCAAFVATGWLFAFRQLQQPVTL